MMTLVGQRRNMTGVLNWLLLLCAAAASAQNDASEFRIVQTAQGPVKGYKNDGIFDFFGIPYATAPTGSQKFRAPLPGPTWTDTLEAIDKRVICPQPKAQFFDLSAFTEQEDCLIANVHMSDTEETNLPVMVYVHGGGYQTGWGEITNTHTLVKSKKIVSLTFNYRLAAHGFLCLGTEDAPGNAGMKDQVALLRWVKKNIVNFGGNPDDVTIVGSSAGSSAVELLMISESTAGLFNKVIPESGTSLSVWSIQQDPVEVARDYARSQNFTNVNNVKDLEEFYKTASYDLLLRDFGMKKDSTFGFSPCIERNLGEETFLEEAPIDILRQRKFRNVPVLYGFANMEGIVSLQYFTEWEKEMNENFSKFLPGDLRFDSDEEKKEVGQFVKQFYFGDQPIGEETALNFVDFYSDIMFTYSHLRATQWFLEAGNDQIYLYEYSFASPVFLMDSMPEFTREIEGANHCAQSAAVHNIEGTVDDDSEEYLKMQSIIQEIWLNFIITGKPILEGSNLPAWPPVGPNSSPYLDFGKEIKLKSSSLLEERFKFWDGIYQRHYSTPLPPPSTAKTEQ